MPAATLTSASLIKLDTLIGLRWIAIGGQTAAILIVGVLLSYPMPVGLCFALTAASAWLNLFLKLRYPSSLRLRDTPAAALLAYDSLQLTGLLYLTGGLENPFALLLLVPVLVSATALSVRHTVALGLLTVGSTSFLLSAHYPLPWPTDDLAEVPLLYVGGVWLADLSALVFSAIYTFRVAHESRRLATALAATEMVLAREHHLSQLDGLAAAAAHELGTPLATIAVVARELQKACGPDSPLAADLQLLLSQSDRCREILGRLTSLQAPTDWGRTRQKLTHLLAEAAEPYRGDPDRDVRIVLGPRSGPEPAGRHNPAIVYGLGNLIENAVDFAGKTVEVAASWSPASVSVEIADDGPGFAPEIVEHIGEPYVTTRGARAEPGRPDHEAGGLGLGFFIAKTFLERSGARVTIGSQPSPRTGAIVRVRWPRSAFADAAGDDDAKPVGAPGDGAYHSLASPALVEPAAERLEP